MSTHLAVHHRLDDVKGRVQVQNSRHHKRSDKDCPKLRSSNYLSKNDVQSKKKEKELLPPLSVLKLMLEFQKLNHIQKFKIMKVQNLNQKGGDRCFGVQKGGLAT